MIFTSRTSLSYQDDFDCTHALILLSDIEKSLSQSSSIFISIDELMENINHALNDCHVAQLTHNALYVFHGDETELAYDGVLHYRCVIENDNKSDAI